VKALVLGAEGQLGAELVRLVGPGSGASHSEVSITDPAALDAALARREPAFVFNCAAYNAVDGAESEPEAARLINAQGPLNVALACSRLGARFIHFSTNFVFDGTTDRPYVETDRPAPLGAYGRSKLEGEQRVLEATPNALVIRTAAVFGGSRGQSFPERILERASHADRLPVVADQRINPTYTKDLAAAAVKLAEEGLEGVVHVVSAGCCTWAELALAVLTEFDLAAEVEPVSSAEFATAAKRPANGCLASIRVAPMRPWEEGLHDWAVRRRSA
jgi:dTDP-4-dehydrorhamnose reductase